MQRLAWLGLAIALACACGKKSDSGKKDASVKLTAAPLALPPLGVDRITRFNFLYGDGARDYARASAAAGKKEWAAARAACEAAIAKDPQHLDAHWLLAKVLAQAGDPAAAVDHIEAAIAGDYYNYGVALPTEPLLKDFLTTAHGAAITQLAQQIHDEYARRIKTALWLIARRSKFRWPDPGVQPGASRAELYAYDRETKRYFRLTHTDHQVAAIVRGANEVAVLGFDRIDHSKTDDTPPLLARSWLEIVDTTDWKPVGPRVTLPAARQVSVGYAAGDQLLVGVAQATGRWTLGDPAVSSVDRTTGKLTKVAAALPVPRIDLTLDEGRLVRAPDGVEAAWTTGPDPTTTSFKVAGGTAIAVPESGQAAESSIAVAPGGARVAFATAVDPCAKDTAPSLYVADAKTAALKHILTAKSRFATHWLDASVLAYEDGDGAIRLWDATTGREAIRLDDKTGFALDVLSGPPVCMKAPPVAEPGGSNEEPLPPEEGSASGGPVTAPQ